MKTQQETFHRIGFTTDDLRNLPSVHAGFLVSSCLAINEISIIQRMLLLALNTMPPHNFISNEELREIAFAQAVVMERNLSAKLLEYLKMIGDYDTKYFRAVRKQDEAASSQIEAFILRARDMVNQIKGDISYSLAVWYRNAVTNHYLSSELEKFVMDGRLSDKPSAYSIYLHEKDGNSSYLLGEQVLLSKLAENQDVAVDQKRQYSDWVLDTSAKIMKLHHDFFIQLFDDFLSHKTTEECKITPESHLIGQLKEASIPILWDFQSQNVPEGETT